MDSAIKKSLCDDLALASRLFIVRIDISEMSLGSV